MSKSTQTLQSVTMAVSNQGINSLFKAITPTLISQSFTAPSMSALSSPVEIPSTYQRIDVNSIELSGGNISNIQVASTPSISYSSSGTPCISLGGSLHIHYDEWYERGSTFSQGATSSSSYADNFGAFDFDITNIDLSFNVAITCGTSAPLQWKVTTSNAQQSNVSVANVAIPSGSELNGSDLGCVQTRVDEQVSNMVADVNYAQKLSGALNGVLNSIPNSGRLTPNIIYQFAPSCDPSFPNNDGLVLGITGAVQFNGHNYSASPVSIPLPTIQPNLDVVVNVAAYELNALLWAAFQNGDLGINLTPQSDSNSETLNSNYYNAIWPALNSFGQSKNANGLPLQVVAGAATAPVASIGTVLQLTQAIYTGLQSQVDAATYANLANMVGIIYYSSSAFNDGLADYLTPAESTQYGNTILNAVQKGATTTVLSMPLSVNVAFNYMYQGSWLPLLSFTINRSNVLSNLSLSNPSGSTDILGFSFSQQNADSISNVKVIVPELDGVATDILDIVWALFSANLNIALSSVGARGLPLPTIDGLCLGSPSIDLCADHGGYVTLAANIQEA